MCEWFATDSNVGVFPVHPVAVPEDERSTKKHRARGLNLHRAENNMQCTHAMHTSSGVRTQSLLEGFCRM